MPALSESSNHSRVPSTAPESLTGSVVGEEGEPSAPQSGRSVIENFIAQGHSCFFLGPHSANQRLLFVSRDDPHCLETDFVA